MRLGKARNEPLDEGHDVDGISRDRQASDTLALVPRDRRGFTLPVAAAIAASDVVPARYTPDGVSDAERHDSPTRRSAITSASDQLGSSTHDAARCVRGGATTGCGDS